MSGNDIWMVFGVDWTGKSFVLKLLVNAIAKRRASVGLFGMIYVEAQACANKLSFDICLA